MEKWNMEKDDTNQVNDSHETSSLIFWETRGPIGPEMAQLDQADHDSLPCTIVAILAIRSDCF